jgi:hypothetical protein
MADAEGPKMLSEAESFPADVARKLKTYVYRLIDPRNGKTFYVGKGQGNRVFSHIRAEQNLDGDELDNKVKRIREIRLAGFEVGHVRTLCGREREMIPSSCHMPDLTAACPPLTPSLVIVTVFLGNGPLSRTAGLHRRTFARLVDKAVAEYTRAREALIAQIEEGKRTTDEMARTGRLIYIFAFVDHLENCLNAGRRLLLSLDHLKKDRTVPYLERVNRRGLEVDGRGIVDVRDTLEHMAERIDRGDIQDGQPVVLCLTDDGRAVSLGDASLRLDTLASVLQRLYSIGKNLVEAKTGAQGAT